MKSSVKVFIALSIIVLFSCTKEQNISKKSELEKIAYENLRLQMAPAIFSTLDWSNLKEESINGTAVLLKIKSKDNPNHILLFGLQDAKTYCNWVEMSVLEIQPNTYSGSIVLRAINGSVLNYLQVINNRIQTKNVTATEQLSIIAHSTEEPYIDLPEVTVVAYSFNQPSIWWSLYWLFNMNSNWFNQYTVNDFLVLADGGIGGNNLSYDEIYNPLFRFPINSGYENLYPKFNQLVKSEIKTYVMQNPNILGALKKLTGLSEDQIKLHLTWGRGPTIKIEDIPSTFYGSRPIGQFRPKDPNSLFINKSEVMLFEQNKGFTQEAMWFLLVITVLHEYVHYGDYKFDGILAGTDLGDEFEREVYGRYINDLDDAKKYLEIYYKRKIK
jgi:hypothetical protein